MIWKTATILALLTLSSSPVLAQEAERYQLEKTDKGYVRLDTQSGAISICEEKASQLTCRAAIDEDRAAIDEGKADAQAIAHLHSRLKAVEARLALLEQQQDSPAKAAQDEREFDQGLDRMESFFRRFMGIVSEFEGKQKPAPDHT